MQDSNGILMIEPSAKTSDRPVIDETTRKMTAAWRKRRESEFGYRGFHMCACGATSDNRDHFVIDGTGVERVTNSLAIHYLAYHREDVTETEIEKVLRLTHGEAEPDRGPG